MKQYQAHRVKANGRLVAQYDNLQQAQAKAAAVDGQVFSFYGKSRRDLRRAITGRQGQPSRPVRRALRRLGAAVGAYQGMKEQASTKPGAMRHW